MPATSKPSNARGGVDLGGTKIQAVIVSPRNRVLGDARRPTPTSGGPRAVTAAIAAAVGEAAQDAGTDAGSLAGVGVGSPGEIDAKAGVVSQARNLPGWSRAFALGPELSKAIGAPVRLGNDVQVATDAEFRLGAGKRHKSILGVFWGTGVGGGIVLDGDAWNGRGSAGEIGHMVVKRGGALCTCGRYGCLEAYAGRGAMELRARRKAEKGTKTKLFKIMENDGKTRLTSGVWAKALKQEDKLATKLIDRAVLALGAGIASAVNLLDVEAVVIGGGLGVRFGEPFAERISAAMQPHVFASERPPQVSVASLGDLGGAVGAALLLEAGAASGKAPARRSQTKRTRGAKRSRARRGSAAA